MDVPCVSERASMCACVCVCVCRFGVCFVELIDYVVQGLS